MAGNLTDLTEAQRIYYVLQTVEAGAVGLASLTSLGLYSVLLWTSLTSARPDEEDRWSFRRSVKFYSTRKRLNAVQAVTVAAIFYSAFQILFLVGRTSNTFSLLDNDVAVVGTVTDVFESIVLYLYSTFAYCLVLCLVKPLVWPNLRQDSFIYPVTLVPPALTLIIRLTMSLVSIPHRDRETNSALNTVTAVICSFLLYLLPLTLVTIATYTTGRRQPEHFLKVCCQRMGVIFAAHLLLADLYYSLYTFHCHCFVWNLETLAWECDRAAGDCQSLQGPAETQYPSPATLPTTLNIIKLLLNSASQSLLPLVPASFIYSVRSILSE